MYLKLERVEFLDVDDTQVSDFQKIKDYVLTSEEDMVYAHV